MFGSKSNNQGDQQEPPAINPGEEVVPEFGVPPVPANAFANPEALAAATAPTAPTASPEETMRKESRKLNLVGSSQLARAVAESVRRGLETQFVLEERQLEAAVRAIGKELLERLKAKSKTVRGLPKDAFLKEVEADRQRIEAAKEAARKELDVMLEQLKGSHDDHARLRNELEAESKATAQVEDSLLAQRIQAIFAGSGDGADMAAIREKITALALGTVQDHRDETMEAQLAEQRTKIERFERRISKLTSNLELTEEELKRIASAKNIDLGVSSIYRNVQGLSSSDGDFETKKELMSCIFQANLDLQKGKAEAS